MPADPPLLELRDVTKHFPLKHQVLRAVDGVSFQVGEGETLAIVGESGCGKTTTARMILHLDEPTSGSIRYRGTPLAGLSGDALKQFRGSVQAVFQDPWSSLNPRISVGRIIAEPLVVNRSPSRAEVRERVAELLLQVGLQPAQARLFPHQFSGGQRQRIAVARALSVDPKLIVLDEPVSALDVSIRAQILNLLRDLQDRLGLSYVLISHHLATVRHMSHVVVVMYLGQIVEMAPAKTLFARPLHPYTRALRDAALAIRPGERSTAPLVIGEIPSPLNPPSGCRFHPRCPTSREECRSFEPVLSELMPGHWVQNCLCARSAAC